MFFYKMKTFEVSCRKVKISISHRVGNLQFSVQGEKYVYLKNHPRVNFTSRTCNMPLRTQTSNYVKFELPINQNSSAILQWRQRFSITYFLLYIHLFFIHRLCIFMKRKRYTLNSKSNYDIIKSILKSLFNLRKIFIKHMFIELFNLKEEID